MTNSIFIFYEGPNDLDFIKDILTPLLEPKYGERVIPQHFLPLDKGERAGYVRYAKCKCCDYIFITDLDEGEECPLKKKDSISRSLKEGESSRVVIACHEIESWYYAGLGQTGCNKLGVPFYDDTAEIDKEKFYELGREAGFNSKIKFRRKVSDLFKPNFAVKCNDSFRHLYTRYLC